MSIYEDFCEYKAEEYENFLEVYGLLDSSDNQIKFSERYDLTEFEQLLNEEAKGD